VCMYPGFDGAMALRSLILFRAPNAIATARFVLWRDDPALEPVIDPRPARGMRAKRVVAPRGLLARAAAPHAGGRLHARKDPLHSSGFQSWGSSTALAVKLPRGGHPPETRTNGPIKHCSSERKPRKTPVLGVQSQL
jgi:hypothetical protein